MTENSPKLSPSRIARREKILDVAEDLFIQNGIRTTTMEKIAADANMSKVTVYGYFSDKNTVFQAVAKRLSERMMEAVENALSTDTPLQVKVTSALVDKHKIIFDVVRKSKFSQEIFEAKNQYARPLFQDLDHKIESLIAGILEDEYLEEAHAKSIARLLFGASTGIANHSKNSTEMSKDIRKLVCSILG